MYYQYFLPISFFKRVSRFSRCFRTPGAPIRKSQCMLECYPIFSLDNLKLCKIVSRSDLVLISFWMLTIPWIFYPLVLQTCISFLRCFRQERRVSVFRLVRKTCRCSTAIHGQTNVVFLKSLSEPPFVGKGVPFLSFRGGTPKMTTQRCHLDSLDI